jgi:hypothetical protein
LPEERLSFAWLAGGKVEAAIVAGTRGESNDARKTDVS